jgi:hypothetical protein
MVIHYTITAHGFDIIISKLSNAALLGLSEAGFEVKPAFAVGPRLPSSFRMSCLREKKRSVIANAAKSEFCQWQMRASFVGTRGE